MSRHSDLPSYFGREPQQSSSSSHEPGYPEDDDDESYLLKNYVKYVPKRKKFERLSNAEIKAAIENIKRKKRDRKGLPAPSLTDIVKLHFRYDDNGGPIQCFFCNYKIASFSTSYLIAHLIGACLGVPPGIKKEFVKSIADHERRFPQKKYCKSSSKTKIERAPASTQDENESNDNQVEINVQEVLGKDATRVKTEKDEDCKIIDHKKTHEREMEQIELEKAKAELREKEAAAKIKEEELKIIQAKRARLGQEKN